MATSLSRALHAKGNVYSAELAADDFQRDKKPNDGLLKTHGKKNIRE